MRRWWLVFGVLSAAVVILVACSVSQPGSQTSPAPTPTSSEAPGGTSPSPGVLPTPTPLLTEKPADEVPPSSGLPKFAYQTWTVGVNEVGVPQNSLADVRTGRHDSDGYDRFVMEFSSTHWSATITPQSSAVFTKDPSGLQVVLNGKAGVVVVVRNTVNHTEAGQPIEPVLNSVPNYRDVKQVAQLGDFEGVVTWGLGVASARPLRAFVLANPSRLVVDIQH